MLENVEIFYNEELGTDCVDARTLHEELKVKTSFNDWIDRRISQYKFLESIDFTSFTQKRVKPTGGRPPVEYTITLDMAKELSMIENNEEGRKARRYFIECEKIAKEKNEQRVRSLNQVLRDETITSRESRIISSTIRHKADTSRNPRETAKEIKDYIFTIYDIKAFADIKRLDFHDVIDIINNYTIVNTKYTLFDYFKENGEEC